MRGDDQEVRMSRLIEFLFGGRLRHFWPNRGHASSERSRRGGTSDQRYLVLHRKPYQVIPPLVCNRLAVPEQFYLAAQLPFHLSSSVQHGAEQPQASSIGHDRPDRDPSCSRAPGRSCQS